MFRSCRRRDEQALGLEVRGGKPWPLKKARSAITMSPTRQAMAMPKVRSALVSFLFRRSTAIAESLDHRPAAVNSRENSFTSPSV